MRMDLLTCYNSRRSLSILSETTLTAVEQLAQKIWAFPAAATDQVSIVGL